MSKAFLIMFEKDMTTPKQLDEFHKALTTDKDVNGWWHHITNAYIIVTSNSVSSSSIRSFSQNLLPKSNLFVLQINYNNYDGLLDKKAWEWIENTLKSATGNKRLGNAY